MIEQIELRDLGVIAEATLPIGPGFTAITGETGAGKTMVVTGLGLLLGHRADSGAVRSGADHASVSGVWLVPDRGAVADRVREAGGELEAAGDDRAELYVGRTISREGRSRATVGGRGAPAGVLADLADELVVVHGQSEQLRLRTAAAQRDAVDRYGGAPLAAARRRYGDAFERWRRVTAERGRLSAARQERADEAEQLRARIAEIEQIDPQRGEREELAQRADRLANAEQLRLAAATAHAALSSDADQPDVGTMLSEARRILERAGDDEALTALAAQLEDVGYRVAEVAGDLSGYVADLDEGGPQELASVQERLAQLNALARDHGSVDAAIDLLATGSARLMELDADDEQLERLRADEEAASVAVDAAAVALTAARTDAAGRLADAVTAELHALALPEARLIVTVAPAPPSATGRDEVTVLLAPHPGAEPRSVAKGASGGELSRVMLAIEVVIAAVDPVPTFVFDEVDAGIGGAAAIEVGRRLARLARTSQVIAVTHLAQVAAFAGNHLSVVKASDGSVTASDVRALAGPQREAEMARLLSGLADSDAALVHARELLALGAADR
ncbi:DNA repair protein RecN [Microbacterium sp.]|uniref:DNA repair protein RecN n=1 Tax=Microbacterium sp. TaxID=51671 RepID=UPI003A839988